MGKVDLLSAGVKAQRAPAGEQSHWLSFIHTFSTVGTFLSEVGVCPGHMNRAPR